MQQLFSSYGATIVQLLNNNLTASQQLFRTYLAAIQERRIQFWKPPHHRISQNSRFGHLTLLKSSSHHAMCERFDTQNDAKTSSKNSAPVNFFNLLIFRRFSTLRMWFTSLFYLATLAQLFRLGIYLENIQQLFNSNFVTIQQLFRKELAVIQQIFQRFSSYLTAFQQLFSNYATTIQQLFKSYLATTQQLFSSYLTAIQQLFSHY